MRQLLIESVLLAGVGGAVGLLVAVWTKDLLPEGVDAPIDWHVLSFALALSCMTGIICGILPAIRATASTAAAALKENSRMVVGSRSLLGKSLLVVQVAVSLVLLIGAGLFLRTIANLRSVMSCSIPTIWCCSMSILSPTDMMTITSFVCMRTSPSAFKAWAACAPSRHLKTV